MFNKNTSLWEHQKELMQAYRSGDNIIVLKARQTGLTTINALYAFSKAGNIPNFKIGLLSYKFSQTVRIISMIANFIKNSDIKTKIITKDCIEFENGSIIVGVSDVRESIHGCSLDLVIFDDCLNNTLKSSEILSILFPCLMSSNSQIIICGTANSDEVFYKLWCNSFKINSSFTPIMINNNLTLKERVDYKRDYGKDAFKKEFGLKFDIE